MFSRLFFLFALLPIIEIALLVNVGEQIGGWNTIALVITTAFVGAYLVRQQGLSTLVQAQQKMQTGQMPGQEMAEGLLLVVAGVLLVTPGLITDGVGFLFSLPFTRPTIARWLFKQFSANVVMQNNTQQSFYQHQQNTHSSQADDIIEGEYSRTDDKDKLS